MVGVCNLGARINLSAFLKLVIDGLKNRSSDVKIVIFTGGGFNNAIVSVLEGHVEGQQFKFQSQTT